MFLLYVLSFLLAMENTTDVVAEGSSSTSPPKAESENIPHTRDGGERSPGASSSPRQFVVKHWPVMGIQDPTSHQGSSSSSSTSGSLGESVAGGPAPSEEDTQDMAVAAEEVGGAAAAMEAVTEVQAQEAVTEETRDVPDLNEVVLHEEEEEPLQAAEKHHQLPDLNLPPGPDENQA